MSAMLALGLPSSYRHLPSGRRLLASGGEVSSIEKTPRATGKDVILTQSPCLVPSRPLLRRVG